MRGSGIMELPGCSGDYWRLAMADDKFNVFLSPNDRKLIRDALALKQKSSERAANGATNPVIREALESEVRDLVALRSRLL